MKKIVLIAMLLLAAPAMAVVTITPVQEGTTAVVAINYDASVGETELVRAFALDITVDSGQTIDAITDYKEGVSVSGDKGYGIFPGSIDINDAGDINDVGTPVGDPCQLPSDTQPGLGKLGGITIEMGSLYVDGANAPDASGLLCKVEVSGDCNLTVAVNVSRGEVVMEGATLATTNLPQIIFVDVADTFTIAGNVASGAAPIKDLEGVTITGLPGDPVTDINGDYTATVDAGFTGTTTPTKAQWSIPGKSYDNVQADALSEDYAATATECYNAGAPDYAWWAANGMPPCWCYRKQCRGDANGSSFLGKPVTVADNNLLKAAFGQSTLPPDGECADFNHAGFLGKRVTVADNDILKLYFGVAELSVPECDDTYINEWKN
ncbi:MAG: hypothetical protein JSW23_09545 [Planctomycetota bacterium]|nr:MAG: hypothetical protein JSW23_09545 [Planctomycetota bacterium]